jgi:uncharacterized protein (DUF885 family)
MNPKIRILLPILFVAFLNSGTAAAQASNDANQKLATIAEQYFEAHVELDPLDGSGTTGEERFEDKLAITIAPEFQTKNRNLSQRILRELQSVDEKTLSPSDAITYQVLKKQMQDQLDGDKFPGYLLPIDQYGGLPVYLAQFGSGQDIQPLKTVKNYDHYLKRLDRIPAWIDQAIANMREGIKRGVVQPKALIVSGMPSVKALTESDVVKNPFYLAIKNMPENFSVADKQRLTAAYKKVITTHLIPATVKLTTFLENEYLPKARITSGAGELPDGEAWYRYQVKYHTTTDMTPDEIHTLGLKEVARILAEMEKIQKSYKFNGSLTEFLQWQNNDKQFAPFKTEQDVLNAYENLNKKIITKVPELFGKAPKAALTIRAEPELTRATASDHYNPPAPDGSRPGVFYTVIENPTSYRNTRMTSLFLHEGQPGHHYQIALQQELSLPKFRKFGWVTAYGEGWALYAETLGKEMGLYEDQNQYLGHLKMELYRAVRLVTDTGLHSKGWTREQTINYMMATEGTTEAEAKRNTERYMAWPGQALAYKIGALKFQELRARAQQKLGNKFSLRSYHDLVLSDGVLPLSILDAKVDAWMAAQQ